MIQSVNSIPEKNTFERKACRAGILREFLKSGYPFAEFVPENGDTARRAYNGLLMAIRRQFDGQISISWRHGHIYLMNLALCAEKEK